MASLLNNQEGATNQSGRPKQNAAILRVPQYRLEEVKFVEELGEGAFGKVCKGELTTKEKEKIFVAVKGEFLSHFISINLERKCFRT